MTADGAAGVAADGAADGVADGAAGGHGTTGETGRPVRVCLLASSFSGSTLLGIMASQHAAFTAFGDTFLRRGAKAEEVICSCGEPVTRCALRTAIGAGLDARGFPPESLYEREFAIPGRLLARRFGGLRALDVYRAIGGAVGYRRAFGGFLAREEAALDALGEARPASRFHLDGSKNLVRATVLAEAEPATRLIHLLRHPFEVFHSAATRHERYVGRGRTIERHVDSWCDYNRRAAELVRRHGERAVSVRFADLVDPVQGPAVIARFSERLGWPALGLDRAALDPTRAHVVGNRSRHEATRVREKAASPSAEALAEIGLGPAGIDKLRRVAAELGLDPL